jgi:hypothetical protein
MLYMRLKEEEEKKEEMLLSFRCTGNLPPMQVLHITRSQVNLIRVVVVVVVVVGRRIQQQGYDHHRDRE